MNNESDSKLNFEELDEEQVDESAIVTPEPLDFEESEIPAGRISTINKEAAMAGVAGFRLGEEFAGMGSAMRLGKTDRPEHYGFLGLGEYASGFARGTVQTGRGFVNTFEKISDRFGNEQAEDFFSSLKFNMDSFYGSRKRGMLSRPEDASWYEKSVGAIGETTPFIASIAASGMLTGGTASALGITGLGARALSTVGSMTMTFNMTFGDNFDGIMMAGNGRVSEEEAFSLAFASTAMQSALEVAVGPEMLIGRATTLRAMKSSGMSLTKLAKAAKRTPFIKGAIKGGAATVFAESGTEFVQSVTQSAYESLAANGEISISKEQFSQAVGEFMYSIPTSVVFGGFGMAAEWQVRRGILDADRGLQSAMEAAGYKYETDEERAAAEAAVDQGFDEFAAQLAPNIGDKGAAAVTDVMKERAYTWAAITGKDPLSYIDTFNAIFTDTELTREKMNQMASVPKAERLDWMRKNIQGVREFEARQRGEYIAAGHEKQYFVEREKYGKVFGDDFLAEVDEQLGQIEQPEQTKEPSDTEKPSEQKDDADERRVNALNKIHLLRQMAAERVGDINLPGNRNTRRMVESTTRAAVNPVIAALMNPDTDSSWVTPKMLRANLVNMIALQSDIAREETARLVESINEESLESVFKVHALMLEKNYEYFTEQEIMESVREISSDPELWGSLLDSADAELLDILLENSEVAEFHEDRVAEITRTIAETRQQEQEEQLEREITERELAEKEAEEVALELDMAFDPSQPESLEDAIDKALKNIERKLDEAGENNEAVERRIGELRALEEAWLEEYNDEQAFLRLAAKGRMFLEISEGIKAINETATPEVLAKEQEYSVEQISLDDADQLIENIANARRESRIRMDAVRVNMALRQIPDTLMSEAEQDIFAFYDLERQWAVFSRNATAEDVLHEWFHHVDMNNLLPPAMYKQMETAYNLPDDPTERDKVIMREKAARDFIAFIKKTSEGEAGQDYPKEMQESFNYLHAVFAEVYKADKGFAVGEQQESSSRGLPAPQELVASIKAANVMMDDDMKDQSKENAQSRSVDLFSNTQTRQDLEYQQAADQWARDSAELGMSESQIKAGNDFLYDDYDMGQLGLQLSSAQKSSTDGDQAIDYKPEVREFFDQAFENVTSEAHHKILAKVLKDEKDASAPAGTVGVVESSVAAEITDENELRHRAHSSPKKGEDAHDAFRRRVSIVTGKEYESGDWQDMELEDRRKVAAIAEDEYNPETAKDGGESFHSASDLNQQAQAQFGKNFDGLIPKEKKSVVSALNVAKRAAASKLAKRTKSKKQITTEADKAIAMLQRTAKIMTGVGPSTRQAAGGGGGAPVKASNRFLDEVGGKLRRGWAWVESTYTDTLGFLLYLDDGNPNGAFTKILGTKIKEARDAGARATLQSNKWQLEVGQKHGPQPTLHEWNEKRSFGTEGKHLTIADAVGIYMWTDAGNSKADKKALFGSNEYDLGNNPDSVLSDVIKFVQGGGEHGFVRYYRQNANGRYEMSKVEKPGFKKTAPLVNYAKAQMELMRKFYPELDAVHFERTGKHLGNLFTEHYTENGVKKTRQRKYFMPGMRKGYNWTFGGIADIFVVDQEVRTKIVKNLFSNDPKYGNNVKYEDLSLEDRQLVNAREEAHAEETGIAGRKKSEKKSTDIGFVESRQAGAVGPELILDANHVFGKYIEQANIYRSKTLTLDYLDAVIKRDEFKITLSKVAGYQEADQYHDALIEMVLGERFPNGKTHTDSQFETWIQATMGRAMTSILGLRLSSQVLQTASGLRVFGEIPMMDGMSYIKHATEIAAEIGSNTTHLSDMLLQRKNIFEGDTVVGEMYQRIKKYNPEILTRMVDPSIQDLYAARHHKTGAAGWQVGKGTVTDVTMSGFRVMDMSTVLNVYTTAYDSKVRELRKEQIGSGKKLTNEQIEQKANDFAGDIVRKTQPASGTTSRNLWQKSRYRVYTPFTGDTMKQFQYLRHDIFMPLFRGYVKGYRANGVSGGMEGIAKSFLSGEYEGRSVFRKAAFASILPMTLVSLIKRRRLPEDEKEWAIDMAAYTASTIPIIGPFFQSALLQDYDGDNTPIFLAPFKSMEKTIQAARRGSIAETDAKRDREHLLTVKHFFEMGASFTGVPKVISPWIVEMYEQLKGERVLTPEDEERFKHVLRLLSIRVAPRSDEE